MSRNSHAPPWKRNADLEKYNSPAWVRIQWLKRKQELHEVNQILSFSSSPSNLMKTCKHFGLFATAFVLEMYLEV